MHGLGRILERNVGLRVRASLADALYVKLANLPLSWHDAHHSGDVQQRAQQASRALACFIESQFVYLQNLVNVIGPRVALSPVSWLIGSLAFAGFVGMALVVIHFAAGGRGHRLHGGEHAELHAGENRFPHVPRRSVPPQNRPQ